MYFGEPGLGHSLNEEYSTAGWSIYIREIEVQGNSQIKCECILQSYVDSNVEKVYRTVSVDVVSTNVEGAYPVVSDNLEDGISSISPISVHLHAYYPTLTGKYILCGSFIMINGMLRVENYGQAVIPTYNCLWKADVKNPIVENKNVVITVTNRHSYSPKIPSILQHTVFDTQNNIKLRLYVSFELKNEHSSERQQVPLSELANKLPRDFTKEKYFEVVFGDKDFSIYKYSTQKDSQDSIDLLSIINTKNISRRRGYFLLGITDEEYDRYIQIFNDVGSCNNVYFCLDKCDGDTVKCSYAKYSLLITFMSFRDSYNKHYIAPSDPVYVYTVDGHMFFSASYSRNIQYYIDEKSSAIVHFRSKIEYDGCFGFDWLRVGDNGLKGDNDKVFFDEYYNYILGTSYVPNKLCDGNPEAYKFLRSEYEFIPIGGRPYYIPYLRLMPGKENMHIIDNAIDSKCELRFFSENNSGGNLVFEYDEKDFELSSNIIDSTDKKSIVSATDFNENITITCIRASSECRHIHVWQYYDNKSRRLAGSILVMPNDITSVLSWNILLVRIKTNIENAHERTGDFTLEEITNIRKVFYQATIIPNILLLEDPLDLSSEKDFHVGGRFIDEYSDDDIIKYGFKYSELDNLFEVLSCKLKKQLKESCLNGKSVVFAFDELLISGNRNVTGKSNGIAKAQAMLFRSHDGGNRSDTTLVHELLHGLGLYHSHVDNSSNPKPLPAFQRYVYRQDNAIYSVKEKSDTEDEVCVYTNNIMGYGKKRIFLWEWQISIIRNYIASNSL